MQRALFLCLGRNGTCRHVVHVTAAVRGELHSFPSGFILRTLHVCPMTALAIIKVGHGRTVDASRTEYCSSRAEPCRTNERGSESDVAQRKGRGGSRRSAAGGDRLVNTFSQLSATLSSSVLRLDPKGLQNPRPVEVGLAG